MRSTRLLRYALFVSLLSSLSFIQPAQASRCVSTTAGTQQWGNTAIYPVNNGGYASQPHLFAVEFTATPHTDGGNVLFGLSDGPKTTWSGIATIVRFKENNTVDVRDGGAYRADQVFSYTAGTHYWVRMEVNLAAHTYSVFIRNGNYLHFGTAAPFVQIAKDYRFRTEQQSVTALNNMVVESEIGGLGVCTENTTQMLAASAGQWQNAGLAEIPLYSDPALRLVYFEVTPLANNSDILLALTNGPKQTWSGLAAIVRFHDDGTIDVRNGDRYMSDTPMTYEPNLRYRVTLYVQPSKNGAPPNYSVAVQPEGGTHQIIARNYAFRTEQQNVQLLNNWTLEAEVGAGRARYVGMDLN